MQATNAVLDLRESREDFQGQDMKMLEYSHHASEVLVGWGISTLGQCSPGTSSSAAFVMVLFPDLNDRRPQLV